MEQVLATSEGLLAQMLLISRPVVAVVAGFYLFWQTEVHAHLHGECHAHCFDTSWCHHLQVPDAHSFVCCITDLGYVSSPLTSALAGTGKCVDHYGTAMRHAIHIRNCCVQDPSAVFQPNPAFRQITGHS